MHFEILVEDASGKIVLQSILGKILGPNGQDHSYKIISYKGVGRIPKNLKGTIVRLLPEIESPREDLAKKLDKIKNYLINQAISDFLSRQSFEEQCWIETLEALESVKSGKCI
ncbi:MAG: hypothetical protein GY862_23255 [Gammaproteobacteria bacterium]|nr:hypothetical protein [Gammaproteobacteria bacterium]